MRTIKAILAIWLLVTIIAFVFGDVSIASEPGQTTCNFLKIGPGARASGMGGAFTSIADDASANYWNPAGLGFLENNQLQFSHNEWYQDLRFENIGIAAPAGNFSFGASFTYLDYGKIESFDEYGYTEGELSVYSLAASISVAARLSDYISVGLTARYIEQSFDLIKGSAFAGDAGIMADFGVVSLGIMASNFGPDMKFFSQEEKLPQLIRAGVSTSPFGERALLAFDIYAPLKSKISMHQGLELSLGNQLFLRTGLEYQSGQLPGVDEMFYDIGLGLIYASGRFDYTFIPSRYSQDAIHSFSIALSW